MGITGLLPLLKSIHKSCHIKKFEGKTLGVDAYGWLHRGAVACAMELATEKPTKKFVDFAMHRVRMMQHFGVVPFLVFDGDYLPSKAATEASRARRRAESKKIGTSLLNAGKVAQAHVEFQKSLDITPEIARQLINELRIAGVQYIVAPYEADSQMVYLENKGIISGIISEDSDLLVFGAKCLLTKLDQYGNCIEVNKSDFSACRDLNLTGWSDSEFRQMAILSGCDYLPSINNMGLKTANKLIRKYKNIEKVIRILQFDGKFHVPKGYLESFYKAELTFLYQRVFCPCALELVLCTEPSKPINLEDMPYIGAFVEPKVAQQVAKGDLHPMTKAPIITPNLVNTSYQRKARTNPQSKRQSIGPLKGLNITSFLKKRTPLAELDLNSFTPSSSQQQTLEGNSGLWTSSPISQPLLQQSRVSAYRSSFPFTEHDWHVNGTQATAEFRSPKRTRLCADTDLLTPNKLMPLHSSPFFNSIPIKSSPTFERKSRYEKSKVNTQIHCDDSKTKDVLSTSDNKNMDKTQENGKAVLFSTQNYDRITNNVTNTACQDAVTCPGSPNISKPFFQPNPTIKSTRLLPIPKRVISSRIAVNGFHGNKKATYFDAIKTSDKSSISLSSSVFKKSRIPLAAQPENLSPGALAKRSYSTPLQRISISATNRNKPLIESSQIPTCLANRKISQDLGSEESKNVINHLPEPLNFRLPTLVEMKNIFLSPSTGTEDLIIFDSEDESLTPLKMENTLNCFI